MIPRQQRDPDEVERYLRRLAHWVPRRSRAGLLLEARRHLYDATLRYRQAGLSEAEAQCAAVRAFGPVWRIGLAARGVDSPAALAVVGAVTLPFRGLAIALRCLRSPARLRSGRQPKPPLF